MTGRFFLRGSAGAGWLSGWWDHAPVLVRPATRAVVRVGASNRDFPEVLAMSNGMVGAVWTNESKSTVRLYSID